MYIAINSISGGNCCNQASSEASLVNKCSHAMLYSHETVNI